MSNDITSLLGDVYGTSKVASAAPTSEDMAKQANLDFFNSLVTSKGIDLDKLGDEQVADLYKVAMEFKAKEEGKDEEAEKKKKEEDSKKEASALIVAAANDELTEKRAAAAKIAEAEFLGKVMAHSFAAESQKIAADMAAKQAGELPPQFGKKPEGKEEKKDEKGEEDEKKEASARAAALVAELTKSASGGTPNADLVAAEHALVLLKEAGVDAELAHARINAVYTLGLPASTKIAAAASNEDAIQARALEFCEAAGFPVNWAQ